MPYTVLISVLYMQRIQMQMDAALVGRMILDGMGKTFSQHTTELVVLLNISLLNNTLSDLKHNTNLSSRTEHLLSCPLPTYSTAKMAQ